MTTGNKPALFGDFSKFWIRIVNGVRFESSVDFAWDCDVVTYRAKLRTDPRLVDPGAIRALAQA